MGTAGSSQVTGMIVGGIVPMVLFAGSNLFAKAGTQTGISISLYVLSVGIAVVCTGLALLLILPDRSITLGGASFSFGMGLCWGIGIACVALGLQHFKVPLGTLVPLYNMNTLLSVLLALWIFAEWKDVQIFKLTVGSLLIVLGGVMVAKA